MDRTALRDVAIVLRDGDDVAVAVRPLPVGATLVDAALEVRVAQEVPAGHKLALTRLDAGAPVRKYGQVIGYATRAIAPGDWVHTHNLHNGLQQQEYEFCTAVRQVERVPESEQDTFEGFLRADGRVGTRNYVAVIAASNCSATVVRMIVDRLRDRVRTEFPRVDGIFAVTHTSGCGLAIDGADHAQLQRTLMGIADHPNTAAALVIGLGCEVNQSTEMIRAHEIARSPGAAQRVPILTMQEVGGTLATVERGCEVLLPMLRRANEARRTTQSASRLVIGTNCGGSDGYSGITANPALGAAGDLFAAQGATWVLAETPETYGAEHLLTRRAVSPAVGGRLVELMRWWERYTAAHDAVVDNNPTPGNKAGGITTVFEKSLGAVNKGGTTPLCQVVGFAERVSAPGLCFMDTPGHDPVSVTGLAAGGCTLIAFTTGRGSCIGCKPSPVLKIATTTDLYNRMRGDMDMDAGVVLNGVPIPDLGCAIYRELLAVASGRRTVSEELGIGDHEFSPWTLGPVM